MGVIACSLTMQCGPVSFIHWLQCFERTGARTGTVRVEPKTHQSQRAQAAGSRASSTCIGVLQYNEWLKNPPSLQQR